MSVAAGINKGSLKVSLGMRDFQACMGAQFRLIESETEKQG